MRNTGTAPAHTLQQVRELLAKVEAHPRCGKNYATTILKNSGGGAAKVDDVNVKKYGRILRKCETVLRDADKIERKAAVRKVALDEIEAEGKIVAQLADKIRKLESEAVKAVEDKFGKSTTFREELVERLKKLEPKLKAKGAPMTFKDFKEKFVGKLIGRTQFYQLRKIARGELTFEEVKLLEREKKQAQKSGNEVFPDFAVVLNGDGTVTVGPRSTGSEEIPIEQRREAMARLAGEELPKVEAPPVAPVEVEDPGIREVTVEDALARFLNADAKRTPWVLWLECSEYLGLRMNQPTRIEMAKACAALARRLNNADAAKKKAA